MLTLFTLNNKLRYYYFKNKTNQEYDQNTSNIITAATLYNNTFDWDIFSQIIYYKGWIPI